MDCLYALCRYMRRGCEACPENAVESRCCGHVLICDGLCCKGCTRVVIKRGHLYI
jgi:hypothetical protein